MKIGTKSVLFGAHQFIIHPLFVALAWSMLYGIPLDPRLWLSFFLHDIGYIGKPNMDGKEGETHPELGATIMGILFGVKWHDFCLFHSRYYAKKYNKGVSRLCVADKLATAMEPWWLYLPRVWATGELVEYMAHAGDKGKYKDEVNTPDVDRLVNSDNPREWHRGMCHYLKQWAYDHREPVALKNRSSPIL